MVFPPVSTRRRDGFTLIELLVVITIVAILAAVLFPVLGSVQNTGRKTQAISDERNLALAVLNYKADFGKLPLTPKQVQDSMTGNDAIYGNPGGSGTYKGFVLINCLRGVPPDPNDPNASTDIPPNPSNTVYFNAQYVQDPAHPRHGVLKTAAAGMQAGTFVDPWGGEYIVFLDANNDHNLNAATIVVYPKHPVDTATQIYGPLGTVQIASLALDGILGKNGDIPDSDDILTVK